MNRSFLAPLRVWLRPSKFLSSSGLFLSSLLLPAVLALPNPASAASGTLISLAADALVTRLNGVNGVTGQSSTSVSIGAYWGGTHLGVVYVFQIPSTVLADSTQQFTAATLTVKTGASNPTAFNGDLYGLGYRTSSTVLASDFYEGALDPANRLIQDDFLVPTIASGAVVTNSGATLVSYLNDQLTAARAANATSAMVFFRINPDRNPPPGGYYVLQMNESGAALAPALNYTTATVDTGWKTVPLGGGGLVHGLISSAGGGAIYCRTDVGGAFRWDEPARTWRCITDRIGDPSVADVSNLQGINSLAVDPANPNKVYVAAGMSVTTTPSGIYMTSNALDAEPTWTPILTTVRCSSNGSGKLFGERLVVDPNNANTIYYGTNNYSSGPAGLIKGTLSGGTWTWTQLTGVPNGTTNVGVSFVACDKNGGSTIVYAGVHGSGVYRSTDGGNTWIPLSGAPTTPARGEVSPVDGKLYVTADNANAYTAVRTSTAMTAVAVPNAQHLIGVAVDPNVAGAAMIADLKNGDEIWYTQNGGTTWAQISGVANNAREYDATGALSRTQGAGVYGIGDLMIDPAGSSRVWLANLAGVMRSMNFTPASSTWFCLQNGQEETFGMDLASSPARDGIVAGLADFNGSYYTDVTSRAETIFTNPSTGNSPSLDFSEASPSNMARTWLSSVATNGSGGVSVDAGQTWMIFGEAAQLAIPGGSAAGWDTWDLKPYLSKHANSVVTLVLISNNVPSSANTLAYSSCEAAANKPELVINGTILRAPVEDACVSGAATATNYGSDPALKVSYAWANVVNTKWIYLKFDLTGIAPITSANLRLYRTTAQPAGIKCTVGVYGCANTGWGESSLTYANRPPTYASDHNPSGMPIDNYDYDPNFYAAGNVRCFATNGTTRAMGGRIAISPVDPTNLVWEPQYSADKVTMPLFYSRDRGVTWTASSSNVSSKIQDRWVPRPSLNNLTVDRVNGVFYFTPGTAGGSAALYSSPDGATWTALPNLGSGVYATLYQLEAAPPKQAGSTRSDLWFANNGNGIYYSRDGAATWTKLPGVLKADCISFGRTESGSGYTVFICGVIGGVKGIYRSDDAQNVSGSTAAVWVPYGLPTGAAISSLAGDRRTFGRVFAGTDGRGIFMRTR